MDIESLAKDLSASKEGIWFPFGEDGRVRIAQWMNKKHAAFMRELGKTHGRRIEQGAIPDKEAAALMAKQWEFIITGLEGFKEKKKPVEYSKDLIERWSQKKEYGDFFIAVANLSRDELNYRTENIQMLGEALLTTQSGDTSGQDEKKD